MYPYDTALDQYFIYLFLCSLLRYIYIMKKNNITNLVDLNNLSVLLISIIVKKN